MTKFLIWTFIAALVVAVIAVAILLLKDNWIVQVIKAIAGV